MSERGHDVDADVDSNAGTTGVAEPDALPRSPFDAEFAARPYPLLGDFRGRCPVARVYTPAGRSVWMITGAQQVREAFLDPRLAVYPGSPPREKERTGSDRPRRAVEITLMNQDAAYHARVRRLASPSLTPRRVERYRPRIEAAATEILDREARGGRGEHETDLMESFARPYPFAALCEVFGIPAAERDTLRRWMTVLFDRPGRTKAEVEAAGDGLDDHMRELVRRRRVEPGDDLVSSIVRAWSAGRADGAEGDDESDVVSLCAMLMLAGFDSTVQMTGICVLGLLTQPDVLRRLRDDPASIPRAVDELLRWDTPGPFGTPRIATEELRIAGAVIPAGSTVLLGIAAANHDPDRYADPELIVLDRRAAPSGAGAAPGARHLSFGLGEHYCLGASLAKLELEVALAALIHRFPLMRLAVPASRLAWRGNHTYRRLLSLPVYLGPAHVPALSASRSLRSA